MNSRVSGQCSYAIKHYQQQLSQSSRYFLFPVVLLLLLLYMNCLPQVERVTYRYMTVSISRGCTRDCWHGCYASGFGLTKLKCTSCCTTPGCNTGNTGWKFRGSCGLTFTLSLLNIVVKMRS